MFFIPGGNGHRISPEEDRLGQHSDQPDSFPSPTSELPVAFSSNPLVFRLHYSVFELSKLILKPLPFLVKFKDLPWPAVVN